MRDLRVACGALLLGLVACSSASSSSHEQETNSEGALTTQSNDAKNCEVFVDKVSVRHSSHGLFIYRVWIKTINDRLDGPIRSVGFHATVHAPDGICAQERRPVGCEEVDQWRDYPASPFVGAADYFQLELELVNDFSYRHQYEGVFYVETDKGTRYWHKTAAGQNFFIDHNGANDIEQGLSRRGTPWYSTDVGGLPVTADFIDYLNPAKCR